MDWILGDGQLDSSELAVKFHQAGLSTSDIHDLLSYLSAMQATVPIRDAYVVFRCHRSWKFW